MHQAEAKEMMGVKLLSTDQRCCFLHLIKQNYLLKNIYKKFNLDDIGISLPVLYSRTNLKLRNISITPKIIFFNCDSLHARLHSHYKTWRQILQHTGNLFRKNLQLKDVC